MRAVEIRRRQGCLSPQSSTARDMSAMQSDEEANRPPASPPPNASAVQRYPAGGRLPLMRTSRNTGLLRWSAA
jgi:hypothetical protein